MRVLYLNPFSQQVSGPDESLLALLEELIPYGIEAHVVLVEPGPQVPRYERLGATVHYAPLTILKRRIGPGAALLPFILLRGVAAVARIARRLRIDVIHTNMEVVLDGAIASRLTRIPHVLHYRGNTMDRPKLVFDLLTRFWTRTAEVVFCISKATASIFAKRGVGDKVEVLYNPVKLDAFASADRSDEVRAELGARPGDVLVGAIGRIHPRKDVSTFLRAAALVSRARPGARFAIVGTSEAAEEVAYEREMRALAAELGIADRLCFAGVRSDVARVLKALDVLVLSSRNEGFGRVVAEAMAAGTPVVATSEGALPELADGGRAALLAPAGDAPAFAAQIASLIEAPGRSRALVERGLVRASAFAADRIAARVREAYVEITTGARG